MMNKIYLFILICVSVGHQMVKAQAGSLDSTFGSNGIVTHSMGSNDDDIHAIALQSDGKIVAAGYSYNGPIMICAMSRYLPDGTLDASFSNDGMLTETIGESHCAYHGVALQTDGKIVAAGFSKFNDQKDFALARYNEDGTPDTSFGLAGKISTDFYGKNDDVWAVLIQPDGKIVVAGVAGNPELPSDFALARYNTDGNLDNTFNDDGKLSFNFDTGSAFGTSLALQTDGKLVISGYTASGNVNDFAMARINSNGTLDATFGNDGKIITIITPYDDKSYSVAIQSDEKIVVAGFATTANPYYKFAVVRYQPDGTLDGTFGEDGIVITVFGDYLDYPRTLVIQQDGKIIVAGLSGTAMQSDFALARYNTNGTLDNNFGINGKVITPVSAGYETIYSMKLQPDGKLVAGGFAQSGSEYKFALARYFADLSVNVNDVPKTENTVSIYPNPLEQQNTLSYFLQNDGPVSITLIDLNGNIVKRFLTNEFQQAGQQDVSLELDQELSQGCYFLCLTTDSGQISLKIIR